MKNSLNKAKYGGGVISLSIKNKAFTLVELIIVVTIIAILATIAFLTLGQYPGEARDVKRLTDKSNIEKALEIYRAQKWEYPTFQEEDWQKIFGTWAWEKVNSSLATLPRDPLTNKLYKIEIESNWKAIVKVEWETKYANWNWQVASNNTSNNNQNQNNSQNSNTQPTTPATPETPKVEDVDTSDENCTIPLRRVWKTIKANKCAVAGEEYTFEWEKYYIGIHKDDVRNKIINRNFPANRVITTKLKSMSSMFSSAYQFNEDISNWDTSNVINMRKMFYYSTSFNQPLNNWNVSNVTNMSWMFAWTKEFNQDISNWDVSKVTDMSLMFWNAKKFNQALNNWDVSNVKNMSRMFYNSTLFNQDISNWDVSDVTDMSWMFEGSNFNQDISWWDVSNVKDKSWIFSNSAMTNENKPPKFR